MKLRKGRLLLSIQQNGRVDKNVSLKSNVEWRKTFSDKQFKCTRCGRCCKDTYRRRRILLTESDMHNIKIATKLKEEKFLEKVKPHRKTLFKYVMRMKNGACIFLKNNLCTIYRSRPLICRSYPLWITLEDGLMIIHADEECPGLNLNKGISLDGKYIFNIIRKVREVFAASDALTTVKR